MSKPRLHTEGTELEGDGYLFHADFTDGLGCNDCDAHELCCKYSAFGEWCLNDRNGKDCVFKLRGIKDKIVVFSIIITHDKNCKMFQSKKKLTENDEIISCKHIFDSCDEVIKFWNQLAKERGIKKSKISFNMYGNCLLK